MISESQISELKQLWQTTELNVAREYVQNVLLYALYRNADVKLAFKGGTALRILKRSPRFSEDLDFTGWGKAYPVGEWIRESVHEAEKAGLELLLSESNATSGGWFALVKTKGFAGPNAWLLIKHKDKYVKTGYDANDYDFSATTKRSMLEISQIEKK